VTPSGTARRSRCGSARGADLHRSLAQSGAAGPERDSRGGDRSSRRPPSSSRRRRSRRRFRACRPSSRRSGSSASAPWEPAAGRASGLRWRRSALRELLDQRRELEARRVLLPESAGNGLPVRSGRPGHRPRRQLRERMEPGARRLGYTWRATWTSTDEHDRDGGLRGLLCPTGSEVHVNDVPFCCSGTAHVKQVASKFADPNLRVCD